MLFFMSPGCFWQTGLFSTKLNLATWLLPQADPPMAQWPQEPLTLSPCSHSFKSLQVLGHQSALVQKGRLPPLCGGGNGEILEHVACKSRRSSASRTGACQQRCLLLKRWIWGSIETNAIRAKQTQSQEKDTPPPQKASESDDTRGPDQCQPQLSP